MNYQKTILKKGISATMAVMLIAANPLYINAQNDNKASNVKRMETVYANLDPTGSATEITISSWLKDSAQDKVITENTDLEDIKNMSSVSYFKTENGELKWSDPHEDIIYQGKIDKKLPVTTNIKYYIDDKEISPKDIAGKSGKVTIKIKLTNNTFIRKNVNGKFENVATPFTAIVVAGFDSEKFTNIHADESKIFSDGNNQMLMFMGFPGLKKSLNIDNSSIKQLRDINLPDEFTITADVKDFELNTIAIALTPELPDFLKDIHPLDKNAEFESDIDTLLNAQDTIKAKDKNNSIKNLLLDQNKTNDAKKLVDDLFKYYDLDTNIAKILPNYVTENNVKLYDKIKADLDDTDLKYAIDNQVLRYIPDRLTDAQIQKVKPIIKDYDELQTLDMDRFDKATDIIDKYDDMKNIIDTGSDLYDNVKNHDTELENLQKATGYTDKIFDLLDETQELSLGGISEDDINYMLKALAEKKSKEATSQFSSLFPDNPNDPLTPIQQRQLAGLLDQAIRSGQIGATTGAQLQVLVNSGHIPEPYRSQIMGQFSAVAQNKINSAISGATTDFRNVLNKYQTLKWDLEKDFSYSYKSEIRSALEYANSIMPQIITLKDEIKKNQDTMDDAVDLLKNKEDMDYYTYWLHKAKDMKKDMDDNSENIAILKDMLNQYDDPKIKYIYSQIPKLRADFDQARPILENFADELKLPIYNKSFHNSPKTVSTLVNMMDDLDSTKYIGDTLNLALSDEIVDVAREVIKLIDKTDENGDLKDIKNKLNDADDIMARKNQIITLSDAYNSFTSSDITNSTVNFVMKTDKIEVAKQKKTFVPKAQQKKSFTGWLKGIFHK